MNTEIAIIGGGASGLAAAIEVRRLLPQAEVLVIERLDRVGKKILATGNGRCNLSNENISARNYHGSFMGAAEIIEHTPTAAAYFKNLGLLTAADSAGRIYPYSNAAASVLTALRLRAEELGVKMLCGAFVTDIRHSADGYCIDCENGEKITAKRVIIATGGCAAPQFGTDGAMLKILRGMGYKITKLTPAVAPLKVRSELLRGLKGVRVRGKVSAVCGENVLGTESGEIQFTESTISGICVFNLAHFYSQYGNSLTICADLAPDMSLEQLAGYLSKTARRRVGHTVEELLSGIFTKNLAVYLVKSVLGRSMADKISSLRSEEIILLAKRIKRLEFPISGCAEWKNSQTTSGGIHSSCVKPTLESALDKGIYFCGEILDVDGDCGGYNLQWAWSSGILAAENCAASLKGKHNDKSRKHKRTA